MMCKSNISSIRTKKVDGGSRKPKRCNKNLTQQFDDTLKVDPEMFLHF